MHKIGSAALRTLYYQLPSSQGKPVFKTPSWVSDIEINSMSIFN